jgi:hypothetical protein
MINDILLLAVRGVLVATNIAELVVVAFLVYFIFLKNHSGTGFLSWHPLRRILFVVFLPSVLFFRFLFSPCSCGRCGNCCDCND